MLAPICLFTYNRLSETQQTVEALQGNNLSAESELFVFSDGPKNEQGKMKVKLVRDYIHSISGFKSVDIFESPFNKGLANSIIDGVSLIVEKYGKVIVLEDDLILSKSFLVYMNSMLELYENEPKIFSISGFGLKIKVPLNYKADVYCNLRPSSWGWATWMDRWKTVDWKVSDWPILKNDYKQIRSFNKSGSDLFNMLKGSIEGNNDSWYIRFAYSQFKQGKYSISPVKSLVRNEGFIANSTHCDAYNRYYIDFQSEIEKPIIIPSTLMLNLEIQKANYSYFSIKMRIMGKILKYLKSCNIIK